MNAFEEITTLKELLQQVLERNRELESELIKLTTQSCQVPGGPLEKYFSAEGPF